MTTEIEMPTPLVTALSEDQRRELKIQDELNAQFQELRREAKGIFDAVKGRRGAFNEEYWQKAFRDAKNDYASGKFLLQRLGADRHLDLPLFATLSQLPAPAGRCFSAPAPPYP
jgi:hypothetical protein